MNEVRTICIRCWLPVAALGEKRPDGQLTMRAKFCDACLDRCDAAIEFDHICQVCATPEEAIQRGWVVAR